MVSGNPRLCGVIYTNKGKDFTMKFRKVVHRIFWGISPKKWMSFDYIKLQTGMLRGLFKSVFDLSRSSTNNCESFEEAMQQAGVSEQELRFLMQRNMKACCWFIFFAVTIFIYALFLMSKFPFESIMVVLLSVFSAVYAWREHYNYTKIKHRLLFLTPKQWWSYFRQKR
jgi:hypothetical protein